MQIFRSLAGYSFGRADIVRRAMAKKKHEVMAREREAFIYGEKDSNGNVICEGAIARGVDEAVAKKIFDEMSAFSSYAFNKSHAAAYAIVAYTTAYLKCHYPSEYFAALLTSVLDSSDKISLYTAECRRLGIDILPPCVNESFHSFRATKSGIRFGLLAIKNLGRSLIEKLIAERENGGEYTSLYDFCLRNYGRDFNRRALEGLIKSGALDCVEKNRRMMIYNIDNILSVVEAQKRFAGEGQLDLFGQSDDKSELKLNFIEEMPKSERLALEKQATGLYLSGHPVADYETYAKRGAFVPIVDIINKKYRDGKRVQVLGILDDFTVKQLKNGTVMAYSSIEDTRASIPITVFATAYSAYRQLLAAGNIVVIRGKVSEREDRDTELLVESVEAVPEGATAASVNKAVPKAGIYIKVSSMNSPQFEAVCRALETHHGDKPVIIVCSDTNKRLSAPERLHGDGSAELISALQDAVGEINVKYIP